jgi:hypothetical protein
MLAKHSCYHYTNCPINQNKIILGLDWEAKEVIIKMCDSFFNTTVKVVGSLCILPFVTLGFGFGWMTIGAIGVIIFVGFSMSAIFLDSIRWIANNFRDNVPEDEASTNRLKKAAKIFIIIFQIMADIKENPLTTPLLGNQSQVPTAVPTQLNQV